MVYAAIAIVGGAALGLYISYLTAVHPVRKWWDWGGASAAEFKAMKDCNIAYEALTISTDFIIFLLPLKSI